MTQVLNAAFAKLPAPVNSNCLPVTPGDPQSVAANHAFTTGNGLVDENANELWSILICKPWLWGELGTTQYDPPGQGQQTVVNIFGGSCCGRRRSRPTRPRPRRRRRPGYSGIATSRHQANPAVYLLFQGNQWATRLEAAFAAM